MTPDRAAKMFKSYSKSATSQRYDERFSQIPQSIRDLVKVHINGMQDALYLTRVFFAGFEAIAGDKIKAESDTISWVKNIEKSRSYKLMARLVAVNTVSSLENYIDTLYEAASSIYESIKDAAKRYYQENKRELPAALKPSGKKSTAWTEALVRLFNVDTDTDTIYILKDLVYFRNQASHEDVIYAHAVSPEQIALWLIASHVFIYQVAIGVQVTVDLLEDNVHG